MSQQNNTAYHPEHLLDALLLQLHLRSDEELSRKLHVAPRIIREIRAGTLPVGASMLIWMSEATGLGIPRLRELMGDRRRTCRLSFGPPRRRRTN
ncbi:hypothetical protein [Noviherbaspirillum aridicola]|uniref:XRE family transcriptional regulator n=1 Tax=Noviherbaspirillum aridicola TaxID=2849687 RepID=A0ABQ4Q053_9BURK|nr:hypothetical protein [Noviherbaspirillum aridicola]GIZ50469.1 hypothetical protein NCCP691_04830 [Noviherbaspirillum aridicola]